MYQYPRYIRKKGDLHDKIYFLERQRPAGRHEERLPGYLPGPRRDVFCLQETKLQAGQIDLDLPGYEQYWNYADRKGYSGTAIFTRLPPCPSATAWASTNTTTKGA